MFCSQAQQVADTPEPEDEAEGKFAAMKINTGGDNAQSDEEVDDEDEAEDDDAMIPGKYPIFYFL